MKKLFIIFSLLLSTLSLSAQEIELEKPQDAFATWTDIIVRKDHGNWHIGGLVEYCSIDKGHGLKNNEVVLRPVVGYNPLSWLRLQFQVDFLYSFYTGFYLRYLPDVSFHWKASDFRFSFRNRVQFSQHVKTDKFSYAVRNRFKVDYMIPKSPVSVHLATEPYWWDRFIKTRYYLGADFKINKNLSLTADYVRYQHYDAGKPDQNVVYLVVYVRL